MELLILSLCKTINQQPSSSKENFPDSLEEYTFSLSVATATVSPFPIDCTEKGRTEFWISKWRSGKPLMLSYIKTYPKSWFLYFLFLHSLFFQTKYTECPYIKNMNKNRASLFEVGAWGHKRTPPPSYYPNRRKFLSSRRASLTTFTTHTTFISSLKKN